MILKWLVYFIYRTLIALWRIEVIEAPELKAMLAQKTPLIFAHWHGDELALVYAVQRYQIATMTSTSKDGSLIDFVIHKLGGSTSRGSSTRGAISALKGMVRLCKSGRNTSFAVDGPRGPIYVPKPGVFELSRLCGAPIVPSGAVIEKAHIFERSWNKAQLPLPFSKVVLYFGAPIAALTKDDDPKDPRWVAQLSSALDGAKQQAAKTIATL